jgi:hypothetical protein
VDLTGDLRAARICGIRMLYGKGGKGAMVEKKSEWWETEQTQRFEMIIPIRLLRAVDAWRKRQPSAPNRSAAIRRLIEAGIEAEERRRK